MSKGEIARDIGRFTPLEAAEHKLQQVEARIAELTGKIPALREVKPFDSFDSLEPRTGGAYFRCVADKKSPPGGKN